ncbi:MAG: peptidoglycan-binding protein [Oscillatoriales cyanobacterium SM2_1_8]|nr:peptidoglycan-binding protein [Oscillatoriales cyanobacterium SM2_1_8]
MQPLIVNFPDNSSDALAERLDLLADRVATHADLWKKVGGRRVASTVMTATVLAGGMTAIALPAQVAQAVEATEDVIALQQLLADNGFSPGAIDGVLGPATIAAIESAQAELGLAVDGIAGPQTFAALSEGGATFDLEDSAYVTQIQRLLTENEFYDGPITGFYGPLTRAAVTQAQAAYDLTEDGIAGPLTLAALQGGPPSTDPGTADSASTRQLQDLLTQRGFYTGPLSGVYGPLTEAAVLEAQAAYGLTEDGLAGPLTLAALQGGPPSTDPGTADSASTRQLQDLLTQRGFYTGPLSGMYGPLTEAAVLEAQAAYGLTEDGIAGPLTLAALRGGAPSAPPIAAESSPRVRQLQNLLTQRGFYTGPLSGIDGPLTEAAVRKAQAAYRLTVDGIAGPLTFAALQGGAPPVAAVPTPTPAAPSTQLSQAEVRELQLLLQRGDFYSGPLDGILGTQTRTAVAAVQRALQLVPDGQPTPTLLATLRQNVPAAGGVAGGGSGNGGTGNAVPTPGGGASNVAAAPTLELQQLLAQRDFYLGPLDGQSDATLTAAIRRAQNWYGLTPADGRSSPELVARLRADRYAKVS